MKSNAITFIKNFLYTILSNLLTMIVSLIMILIIPKWLNIEDYGFWQLYLFYSSYVGLLHFGWNDGIYLRYGGTEYKDLNKQLFFSQFWIFVVFQFVVGIFLIIVTDLFVLDNNKVFILVMTAICMFLVNSKFMLTYILQATNNFKEFAQIKIVENIFFFMFVILFLIFEKNNYKLLITADLLGKFISLLFSLYICKDIVINKISCFFINLREILENISSGVKLMFSNLASTLIIGTVQFGIERVWSVETFGKVSLTLNISNFIMVFINAVGIVMFPLLRRTDREKLSSIYKMARIILMVPLLGVLLIYSPIKTIFSIWLPMYSESLKYMAILFPMCIYEGKMALLINTYLKTLRKEKLMLFINLVAMIIGVIFTVLCTIILENLILSLISMVLVLAFRCIFAEICIMKILKISSHMDILLELTLTITFILAGYFLNIWSGLLVYLIGYLIYLLLKRSDIKVTFKRLKQLVSME